MRRLRLSLLLLSLSAAACTHAWVPQYGPAPQVVAAHAGGTVHVIRASGPGITLRNVRLSADSVVGEGGTPPARVAIPFSDVEVITVPRSDHSRVNRGIVVVAGLFVALAAVTIFAIDSALRDVAGN